MPLAFVSNGIKPGDLGGDEDVARRVLVRARDLAPAIATFPSGSEPYLDAVAILKAVAKRLADIGTGTIASQGRNGTTISSRDIRSAFFPDDIADLRALTLDESTAPWPSPALPRGSFPTDRPVTSMWPEKYS